MLIVVVLLAAIITGVVALFVRGFRINDLMKDEAAVVTPSMQVWLVETTDYASKMDAYKVGISQAADGFATHVYEENDKWALVEGVYLTQEQANAVLQDNQLPEQSVCREYRIAGKQFKLDKSAAETCNAVLQVIQQTFNKLLEIRDLSNQGQSTQNAILEATEYYNSLKKQVEELNAKNETLRSELVATIVYAANQNILSLHEVIFSTNKDNQKYLSVVNTAIVKSIFSLDNF